MPIDTWLPLIRWLILYVGVSCFFLGIAVGLLWAAFSSKKLPIERSGVEDMQLWKSVKPAPKPPTTTEIGKRIDRLEAFWKERGL